MLLARRAVHSSRRMDRISRGMVTIGSPSCTRCPNVRTCTKSFSSSLSKPVIGAWFAWDEEKRRPFVRASPRLTHTDPRAEVAAQAVAETAAWWIRRDLPREAFVAQLAELSGDEEWIRLTALIREGLLEGWTIRDFVAAMGLQKGITGYAYHTGPVALFAAHSDRGPFRETLEAILDEGGDTDSVGAISGALLALREGAASIPREWLDHIIDRPVSVPALERLAGELAAGGEGRLRLSPWKMLPRNLVLLGIVLVHGVRRLWPW